MMRTEAADSDGCPHERLRESDSPGRRAAPPIGRQARVGRRSSAADARAVAPSHRDVSAGSGHGGGSQDGPPAGTASLRGCCAAVA